MNAPQLSQSNVSSLPPPTAGVAVVLESQPENGHVPGFQALPLPTAPVETTGCSPVTSPAAQAPAWRLPATVGPFLAKTLRNRWESYRTQLHDCQANFSERSVHELRVATRRLIAQFVMLGCVTRGTTVKRARRVLKRRLKALGELRDTHVQRLFIERHLARFQELIFVRDFLERREGRLEKAAAAKVKDCKTQKLEKWMLALEQHLTRKTAQARGADRLGTMVAEVTTKAFADVVRRRQAIDPANPSTVHRSRIAFKKFRYMAESLSPEFTGLGKRELRVLAQYQRRMGILQDLEVMQRCIAGFVKKQKGMESLFRPFTRYLQASRRRALQSFLKSADDLYKFWPPWQGETSADIVADQAAA